jgi:hypothetical protein
MSFYSSPYRRVWDAAAAQGVCDTPLSIQRIPDFPILAATWDAGNGNLICGGGGGSTSSAAAAGTSGAGGAGSKLKAGFSFIGTPVYALKSVLQGCKEG